MSATSFNFSVIVIPSSRYGDPNLEFPTLNQTLSFALEISSPNDFDTLYSQDGSRGNTFKGLLYVPDIPPDSPCDTPAIVPRNVTRKEDLPMDDLKLIAYAPLITPQCSRVYMDSAENDNVAAFIFFGVPQNYSNGTDPINDESYQYEYPVYYLDGAIGQPLMNKLAEYSGNMSEVPNEASLQTAGYDLRDFARIYAVISTRSTNPMPGLWLFLLVVVAVLLFIIGASSLLMHLCQFHYRRSLRRRIANGEVDLEGLGIGRITVPREFLAKFPMYVYIAETSTQEPRAPPAASLPPPASGSSEPKPPVTETPSSEQPSSGQSPPPTTTDATTTAATVTPTRTTPIAVAPTHLGRGYSQTTCPICLEDFIHQETTVRELPCLHVFHPECIDPYLESQSSLCVLCKQSCLPKGYVPIRLTNAIVRRERLMRRVRARSRIASTAHDRQRDGAVEMAESGGGALFRWRVRRLRRQEQDLMGREALSRASLRMSEAAAFEYRRGGVAALGHGRSHRGVEVVEDAVRPRWRETMDRIFPGFR
ncbi:Nucleolar protein 58 [Orbilia brochopaga]|uniref:Nucleolar protein 58 n=1 Tax=Orbilia brochopaga TaxID=3140254 RepID=A0AAV9UB19_9PEZI